MGYMILNWLAFLVISGRLSPELDQIKSLYQNVSTLFGLLLIPLSVILEGLISSDFKHKLVFWKIKNPLPASRAFTEIAPRDSRIDMAKLELLMENGVPLDPDKQNAAWYALYKKHSSKELVFDAHKSFLLTRDLASLSFLLIPSSIAAYMLWRIPLKSMAIHPAFLSVVLLMASRASQNYGKRFVGNVLVETLHSEG